ncbi:MAG: sporulation protein YqfD [Eubacteriales bacterium]|nr:sporulation protein YqfD [Eubacteriales bacterium]
MKERAEYFLGGYLLIRLTGFSKERFLNLCMAKRLAVSRLEYQDGGCQFIMPVKDFRRVRPLVKKAGVRLRIMGRYGLPFFLYRNRKRKLSAAGAAVFFLILFVMSRFIWNIGLEGNYRLTDDMLLHYLDSMDIRYGMRKSLVDCDALEESIRSRYPEVVWISARVSGTRLLIRIRESNAAGEIPLKDETPRDLAADCAGRITRMIVRGGKALVGPGDEISPGDILVSGRIPVLNDSGEEVNALYVRADADIWVKTEETYAAEVPFLTSQRTRTGAVRRGIRIRLPGLGFLLMLPAGKEENWEISCVSRQAVILGDFYLPVWTDRLTACQYSLSQRPWTREELETIKNLIHERKMQNFTEKGVQIIENDVKMIEKDGAWEVQGRFVLERPAGIGQNIRQEEETRLPDERN